MIWTNLALDVWQWCMFATCPLTIVNRDDLEEFGKVPSVNKNGTICFDLLPQALRFIIILDLSDSTELCVSILDMVV